MPLTDPKVKNAPAKAAQYKLADSQGMYLLVKPDGGKYWRLKYRFAGKEKLLALGVYDEVSLKDARGKRDEARAKLAKGIDPGAERKTEKLMRRASAESIFEGIAREWYAKSKAKWSEAYRGAVLDRLEKDLFPSLGTLPVATISPPLLIEALRKLEARGAHELLQKARVAAGQVFRYAIATHRMASDPTRDLRGIFTIERKGHYARLNEDDLPGFLMKLQTYDGSPVTRLAMTLLALTFVRTGELRGALWSEFDLTKHLWRIPPERMKGRQEHLVPLSSQAIAALEELRAITGKGDYLFPNERDAGKCMSENAILYALYRMGYHGRATGHGFRHTASTILNEQQFNPDWIEKQLAHTSKDKIRGTYNAAEYLPGRRQMMQAWADFLDAKRAEGDKV